MPEASEIPQAVAERVCAKCGSTDSLSRQWFEKTYTPKWVYLGLLCGLLPGLLLFHLASKRYRIEAPFCAACWKRLYTAKIVSQLVALPCLVLFFVVPIFGIVYSSWLLGIGGLVMGAGIAVIMDLYQRAASPKCVLVTRERLVLEIPGWGRVDMVGASK